MLANEGFFFNQPPRKTYVRDKRLLYFHLTYLALCIAGWLVHEFFYSLLVSQTAAELLIAFCASIVCVCSVVCYKTQELLCIVHQTPVRGVVPVKI